MTATTVSPAYLATIQVSPSLALVEAISMLTEIQQGNDFDDHDFHARLAAIRKAAAKAEQEAAAKAAAAADNLRLQIITEEPRLDIDADRAEAPELYEAFEVWAKYINTAPHSAAESVAWRRVLNRAAEFLQELRLDRKVSDVTRA